MLVLLHLLWAWVALVAAEIDHAVKLTELSMALPDGIIAISNADLSSISQPDREHYTLIAITSTDPEHNCDSCQDLQKMLKKVARAWFSDYIWSHGLFFATVDLADKTNKPMFDFLQLKTVPQVWLVPPSAVVAMHTKKERVLDEDGNIVYGNYEILLEPHANFEVPDASLNTQTFELADWLARTVQKKITLRQDNAQMKFITTFAATFGAILLIKKRGPGFITGSVSKALIYKILTLFVLFVILGGYSFTTIQSIAFLAKDAQGKIMYVSGSMYWQFGDEIVLVGLNYFLLGATIVSLLYLGRYQVGPDKVISSEAARLVLTIVGAGVLYLLYSALTSMFLRKDPGYPYHFHKLF